MAAVFGGFTFYDLDPPFELKIDTPLIRAVGNVYANFDFFLHFFLFELRARVGVGQTDRQEVMLPIRRPHNKLYYICAEFADRGKWLLINLTVLTIHCLKKGPLCLRS